jgi:hypothetical protein
MDQHDVPAPNAVLTAAEVAAWLQIKPRQVQRLGIPQLRLGHKTIRYRASAVAKWLEKQAKKAA